MKNRRLCEALGVEAKVVDFRRTGNNPLHGGPLLPSIISLSTGKAEANIFCSDKMGAVGSVVPAAPSDARPGR
jgi:hypothetical protein